MKRNTALTIILAIWVIIGIFFLFEGGKLFKNVTNGPTPSESIQPSSGQMTDLIKVETPQPNELVDPTGPLTIKGEARGNWYFEASFPVKLLDANGSILSQDSIQAQEDCDCETQGGCTGSAKSHYTLNDKATLKPLLEKRGKTVH